LELGWQRAGYYTTAAEAIYWDERNANGEFWYPVGSTSTAYKGLQSDTQDGDPEVVADFTAKN